MRAATTSIPTRPSSRPPARQVLLIVPGLRLPAQMLRDLSFDLPVPGLRALLANARLTDCKPADEPPLIRAAIAPEAIEHAAPLRLLGLGGTSTQTPAQTPTQTPAQPTTHAQWLCLDPVHLGFRERAMVVGDPEQLHLTANEANELVAALNPLFADFGQILATRPGQWHMQTSAPAPAFPPLASAIGGGALRALDGLGNTPQWRRLLNEAQMLLHAHPVNQGRQARDLPVVNSLWPWGHGSLPVLSEKPAPHYCVHTTNAVLQGLTFHYGQQVGATATSAPAGDGVAAVIANHQRSPVLTLDRLRSGALTGDAHAWREGLSRLDEEWFSPLFAAWQDGSLGRADIRLLCPANNAPDDAPVVEARLAPRGFANRLSGFARRLGLRAQQATLDELADD